MFVNNSSSAVRLRANVAFFRTNYFWQRQSTEIITCAPAGTLDIRSFDAQRILSNSAAFFHNLAITANRRLRFRNSCLQSRRSFEKNAEWYPAYLVCGYRVIANGRIGERSQEINREC